MPLIDYDYWIGVSECVCRSQNPIGACLHCDLVRMREEYLKFLRAKERKEEFIILNSSHGSATFDRYGHIVEDHLLTGASTIWADDHPIQLDLVEWCLTYPGECPYGEHDILDWGYTTVGGAYEEPCLDWRKEHAALRKENND